MESLYPNNSQVYEMLCCAEKCGNRANGCENGTQNNPFLSFGEFSVFATAEMKRASSDRRVDTPASKIAHKTLSATSASTSDKCTTSENTKSSNSNHKINEVFLGGTSPPEVFLGGSCNPTTWRREEAIPTLKNFGISYYNPQVEDWSVELISIEHEAKTNANVLFFVIDQETRGIAAMIEVAYLVAKGRKLILVITGLKRQEINSEPITQRELEDLTSGLILLQELVERHEIPVFNNINLALHCTAKVIKEKILPQDLKPQKINLQNSFNLWVCKKLQSTFDNLDTLQSGYINIQDIKEAYRKLTGLDLTRELIENVLDKVQKTNASSNQTNGHSLENNKLNFDQYSYIITQLVLQNNHNYKNLYNSWPNFNSKTSNFLQSIILALSELLVITPESNLAPPLQQSISSLSHSEDIKVCESFYDVFLGGSLSNSENYWRTEIAIPLFKKNQINYVNSDSLDSAFKNFLPKNSANISKCKILLFYIEKNSRSIQDMLEAAYYIGLGCEVVMCIENLSNDSHINGEKLSSLAIKDYNRGRAYLSDIANLEGIKVFEDISESINFICNKLDRIENTHSLKSV